MDTRKPDLNLLLALEALLAERNVTRAAARLHLSQPAVSAQLTRLRDLFADPLFLPAQRGMTPTAMALQLEGPLRAALDALRKVMTEHRGFDPLSATTTISVAASDYVHSALVQRVAMGLRLAAPSMRIAMRQLDVPALEMQMERGAVDIALLTPDTIPALLRRRTLYDERYLFIARHKHPRIRRRLTLEAICDCEHIVVSPRGGGFDTAFDRQLATGGLKRSVVLSAATFLIVPEIVATSDLVALVPAQLVQNKRDRLQIRELPVPVKGFSMGMAWHGRTHAHPEYRWVREQIVKAAAGLSANKHQT